jgi:hypothetical protein
LSKEATSPRSPYQPTGTEGHIGPGVELVPHEVLEYDRQPPLPGAHVQLGHVGTVDRDPALARPVQAGQQLDQRGLACAVEADYGRGRPHRKLRAQVVEDQPVAARVGEARTFETHGAARQAFGGLGPGVLLGGGGEAVLQLAHSLPRVHPVTRVHVRFGAR